MPKLFVGEYSLEVFDPDTDPYFDQPLVTIETDGITNLLEDGIYTKVLFYAYESFRTEVVIKIENGCVVDMIGMEQYEHSLAFLNAEQQRNNVFINITPSDVFAQAQQ